MSIYFETLNNEDCNGCGICELLCPTKAIKMIEDSEGFLYPKIDKSKCIDCGKCKRVCSNCNNKTEENEKAYIAVNNSDSELYNSSSGGMFYILAKYVIDKNGVVFGVVYDENLEVIHTYADNIDDCKKFCGSKYVRSNLLDSYVMVKKFLDEERWVLFTGTACQISGLKNFLGKDYEKLVLCDVLCHANPSPKVFKLYVKNLEQKRNKKVKNVYFRSKDNGWKNQTPIIEYDDGFREEENSYFNAFVKEMINRPSCYFCKFASKRRISDFTIGDFWGIEKISDKYDMEKGVSLLNVNSERGKKIFEIVKNQMVTEEVDYDFACSLNHYKNVNVHKNRDKFFEGISNGSINENNIINYMQKYAKRPLYKKVFGFVKRNIKKIFKKC